MTMQTFRKVLVHLSKENGIPKAADFQQSIVGFFCQGVQEDALRVHCGMEQSRFLISNKEFPGSRGAWIQRPASCPMKLLSRDPSASLPAVKPLHGGVDAAVATLLQSAGGKVLLTRRSPRMALFPDVWVPPGGHIEPNEQLLDAGLRELQEETGLKLSEGEFSWSMLGLWEARLKPNEGEVSAYAWLDVPVAAAIAGAGIGDHEGTTLPPTVSITEVDNGSSRRVPIPTATFFDHDASNSKGVSAGTRFALWRWLRTMQAEG
ncbi:nucleoside diphosphate-linked moiety X motif 17 isoform X2 [Anolis sagrei]|uniref:nucleoside diphosphate-linked moiety X motif 17 isoform X2 n=1 Tax=Anolis sagrei TaxID=38937 RepID=UPI00352282D5